MLEIDGRPVEVLQYTTYSVAKIVVDALTKFAPDFSVDVRSKAQLRKMPIIEQFLNSLEHCHITEFLVEMRLWGKND